MPENLLDTLQNLLVEHQNKMHLCCYESCFCWGVQELIASVAEDAAQQSMHWTGGESAPLQAESTPEVLSPSLAVSTPPTCQ